MPIQSRYLFTASMDIDPDREALFNEVYNQEHVPELLRVPGVLSAARFKTRELVLVLGGQRRTIVVEDEPKYTAMYEIESPEVLTSEGWAEAADRGRWAHEVRSYTKNRRHLLRELILSVPWSVSQR